MKTVLMLLLAAYFSNAHADSWNESNNPANFDQHYHYAFKELPLSGSVDAAHIPWSDNYWESDLGGISLRWHTLTTAQLDPDLSDHLSVNKTPLFNYVPPTLDQLKSMSQADLTNLSPAEKYDILMGNYDYPTVYSERKRTSPDMEDWQGICHGWVPAAIQIDEPKPYTATNSDGVSIPFGSSDIKGLLSYYYGITAYDFARGWRTLVRKGNRFRELNQVDSFDPISWVNLGMNEVVYDEQGDEIGLDSLKDSTDCADSGVSAQYGSVEKCLEAYSVSGDAESLDLVSQVGDRDQSADPNAGAFFVVIANQLGLMHKAFAANLNRSGKEDQIWNQPVSGYSTTMDYDHRGANGAGNVGLTTTLTYVTEIPQNTSAVVGTPNQRFDRMVFSYELDIDASGNVTGGSWKQGTHPSFLWKHEKLPIKGYFSKVASLLQ